MSSQPQPQRASRRAKNEDQHQALCRFVWTSSSGCGVLKHKLYALMDSNSGPFPVKDAVPHTSLAGRKLVEREEHNMSTSSRYVNMKITTKIH